MSVGRRGFTLVELIIALVLMTLVGTVIFQLLNGTQRVSTAQAERMMLQSSIRTGAIVVPAELREISTSTGGQTDLVDIATDSVTYRAARGIGFTCAVTGTEIKILNTTALPFSALRAISPGRDSLLLFVDGDPDSRSDDAWVRLPISSVATSTCGTEPAIAVTLPNFINSLPDSQLVSVVVGGPVRTEEVMRLKSYTADGQEWVGAESISGGDAVQPILGPIAPGGFALSYFTGDGTATNVPANVRVIGVTVIGLTERAVAQGGNTGANAILQDTLVTRVLLRNAPR
jgi:prepilin-type N-terminal cleavage/methylation domain-containing protein